MKRVHIHVGVPDLEQGIRFYSALFGNEPDKTRDDYAKWMLEDPRMNFAISTRVASGVDHLGIQTDDPEELQALRTRLEMADMSVFDEGETTCCYARSDKSWVRDPAGVPWEGFRSMADLRLFSEKEEDSQAEACCTPRADTSSDCCPRTDSSR